MSDADLNLACHTEVEGWEREIKWWRKSIRKGYHTTTMKVPDYCHDPAWCVAMQEKYKFHPEWLPLVKTWLIRACTEKGVLGRTLSEGKLFTRAVALAVLALHREGT